MNSVTPAGQEPIPKSHLAEACVWVTRLHGDDRDPAMEEGFRKWLKADPLNARAFERTTAAWDDSINLRRVVPFAHEVTDDPKSRAPRRPGRTVFAIAASVLLVVGAVFLYRLYLGGGYTTGVGEQRTLVLKDGSRVYLNTDTRVIDRYGDQERRVELESGEALFEVAQDPFRPFIVRAGGQQIRALGTSFVVRYDQRETAVTLVDGKVAVSRASVSTSDVRPATSEPVILAPGQRLTIASKSSLSTFDSRLSTAAIDTPSLEAATAWRHGQVVLDDTPLAAAVVEMNRYSTTKLVIERAGAGELMVNGLFQAGDSGSFAKVVAEAFNLQVQSAGDTIVLK